MMGGVDPDVVKRAIELKLIDPADADRFLRDTHPARPLALVPKKAPPPERLTLIRRPNGRLMRARQRFTKALLAARIVDPAVVKARHPTPRSVEEDTA